MNKFKEGVEATRDLLVMYGFVEKCGPIVTNYNMNVSKNRLEHKEVSVTISRGNQYIMIRQGSLNKERHQDDVVVLYNGDYDGKIMMDRLNSLMFGLTGKWLEVVDSVKKC